MKFPGSAILLEEFVQEAFASLPRRDQRGKGSLYLQGLMLDGRRKSMQPMGERLGIDYQQLQQFVSSSVWPVEPVRPVLAGKAMDLIEPDAWVIDNTEFAKDGPASPRGGAPVFGDAGQGRELPDRRVRQRRHRPRVVPAGLAPVPARVMGRHLPGHHRRGGEGRGPAAEGADPGHRVAPVEVGTSPGDDRRNRCLWAPSALGAHGCRLRGECAPFRTGLTGRGIAYVAAVKPDTSIRREERAPALMDYTGCGPRPHTFRYQDAPVSVKDLAVRSRDAFTAATWRHGTRTGPGNPDAAMSGRFAALRVRPANRNLPRDETGILPAEWLIAEGPEDATEPTGYWLSTLPGTTPLAKLVRLAKIRWRIGHDYRELKHGLGLDHFEGRTWLGWHHHATLVTAAHLFVTTVRLAAGPKAPQAA